MPRDPVVDSIAQPSWNQIRDRGEPPESSQVPSDAHCSCRANPDLRVILSTRFKPDDRIDSRQLRMLRADRGSQVTLQRGKAERMLPFAREYESHARRAKPARAIVEEDRSLWQCHGLVDPVFVRVRR